MTINIDETPVFKTKEWFDKDVSSEISNEDFSEIIFLNFSTLTTSIEKKKSLSKE